MIHCKRWIKRCLLKSGLLSLAQRLKSPRMIILRYHSVQREPNKYAHSIGKGIIHSLTAFQEQMEWLARHYEPVTLDEVVDGAAGRRSMPKRGVAVTFDDGFADNFEVALPVLNRLGMSGAFYVTVGCIDPQKVPWFCRLRHAFATTAAEVWTGPLTPTPLPRGERGRGEGAGERAWRLTDARERRQAFLSASGACARQSGPAQDELLSRIERELGVAALVPEERLMMSWEQIRELRRQGHTVGSHTMTHPNLAQVGRADVTIELRESKRHLEEKLGGAVNHFSYPSPILQPHWNDETIACCGEQGYRTAVTCTPGAVLPADSPLCLRRISAPERLEDFKWAIQSAFVGRYV